MVNSTQNDYSRLTATARVYNLDASQQFSNTSRLVSKADAVDKVFTIPALPNLSETYFVRLTLEDGASMVSENFYWLPRQQDELDFTKSTWYLTPTQKFGSLQALSSLPQANVQANVTVIAGSNETQAKVTLKNSGKTVALGIDLRLQGDGEEVLPVLWSDNYIALMPGERKVVEARVHASDSKKKALRVRVKGWNVQTISVADSKVQ